MGLRHLGVALLLASCAACTGCTAPPVGFWESDNKLGNGKRNKLEVYDDYTGNAKLYATLSNDPETWYRFEFDIIWEDFGDVFEFDLNCSDGPCESNADDFDMECEVIELVDETEAMDCDGNKKWKDYLLQWQRNID